MPEASEVIDAGHQDYDHLWSDFVSLAGLLAHLVHVFPVKICDLHHKSAKYQCSKKNTGPQGTTICKKTPRNLKDSKTKASGAVGFYPSRNSPSPSLLWQKHWPAGSEIPWPAPLSPLAWWKPFVAKWIQGNTLCSHQQFGFMALVGPLLSTSPHQHQ